MVSLSRLPSDNVQHELTTLITHKHPEGMLGRVRTKVYRGYFPGKYPPNLTGVFCTAAIPYRTLQSSYVLTRYRYPTLRYVRYDLNTGTPHFGEFGTISIPVPDSSVRVLYRIPGVFTLPNWFGTASIPYRNMMYRSVRTRTRDR